MRRLSSRLRLGAGGGLGRRSPPRSRVRARFSVGLFSSPSRLRRSPRLSLSSAAPPSSTSCAALSSRASLGSGGRVRASVAASFSSARSLLCRSLLVAFSTAPVAAPLALECCAAFFNIVRRLVVAPSVGSGGRVRASVAASFSSARSLLCRSLLVAFSTAPVAAPLALECCAAFFNIVRRLSSRLRALGSGGRVSASFSSARSFSVGLFSSPSRLRRAARLSLSSAAPPSSTSCAACRRAFVAERGSGGRRSPPRSRVRARFSVGLFSSPSRLRRRRAPLALECCAAFFNIVLLRRASLFSSRRLGAAGCGFRGFFFFFFLDWGNALRTNCRCSGGAVKDR